MGEADQLVPLASSRRLADCFAGAAVHVHEGGHLVPSSAALRAQLKDFVVAQARGADGDLPAQQAAPPEAAPGAAAAGEAAVEQAQQDSAQAAARRSVGDSL